MGLFDDLKKTQKKDGSVKMTQDECFKIIDSWGEHMELYLSEKDFNSIKEEIWIAVQNERLSFDPTKEIFTYVFRYPIKGKDDNIIYSMIKIHNATQEEKRGLKKKDNIDTQAMLHSAHCKDSEMKEIPIGFLTRLFDADTKIMNAVILGFFVQAVPSAKSEE